MISERSRGLFAIHCAVQVLLITSLFWTWLGIFLAFYKSPEPPSVSRYALYSLLAIVALLIKAAATPTQQRALLRLPVGDRLQAAFLQAVWITVALLFFLVAAKDKSISRVFLFTWLVMAYGVLSWTNAMLPAWLALKLFQGNRVERTVLFSTGGQLDHLGPWLNRQERLGLRVLGIVSDNPIKGVLAYLPILGGSDELERVLAETRATQLLLTGFPMFRNLLEFITRLCERRGVRLMVLSDFEEKFGHAVTLVEEDGLRFLTLRDEPLESPFNRILKRGLDIAVALPVVLFLLPWATLLVWIFQRFQAPGPVFFRQPRAGLQNDVFKILKFRSMYVANDDVARQATAHDSRIYPAGGWFRKLSIDELPQFVNVLRGEMSVVGPRPHLLDHNERWARIMANYHVRAFVKPGITGLAQVRGFRGEAKTDDVLRLRLLSDVEYIENWSFALDCLVIVRTAWQVFSPPKSAY